MGVNSVNNKKKSWSSVVFNQNTSSKFQPNVYVKAIKDNNNPPPPFTLTICLVTKPHDTSSYKDYIHVS